MRLFTPASLALAAAAALLTTPTPAHAAPAHAAPAHAAPTCAAATSDAQAFPLTTRIHGGPATYEAGGGYGTWYLDLTNTTTRTCADIHPVVVLVDERRTLRPGQPQLEFYEGPRTRTRPRPVRFETTDEDELVGAFGGEGLTVGPGRTVTVKVRLALTSDAVPNEITANAAVVQRHDDDGDWVGQSNDYRFTVDSDADTDPESPSGTTDGGTSSAAEAGELAHTGPLPDAPDAPDAPTPRTLAATAAALLLTGTALLRARRSRR
jgi:hypothetical protein